MFHFDNVEYDETKLSEEGKIAFVQLQNLAQRRNQLSMEYDNLQILSNHYTDILKSNLPEEEKVEESKESK
jgi:cell division protein FtsL